MEEQIPWNRVLLERSVLFLSGQQIHRILWNTKFHYLFHNRLLLVPILSQITPVYTIRLYIFCFILILLSDLSLGHTSGLFFSLSFPTKILCAFVFSPYRATCPARYIVLDLVRTEIVEFFNMQFSASSCFFLVRPKYLPQHPILEYLQSILS